MSNFTLTFSQSVEAGTGSTLATCKHSGYRKGFQFPKLYSDTQEKSAGHPHPKYVNEGEDGGRTRTKGRIHRDIFSEMKQKIKNKKNQQQQQQKTEEDFFTEQFSRCIRPFVLFQVNEEEDFRRDIDIDDLMSTFC